MTAKDDARTRARTFLEQRVAQVRQERGHGPLPPLRQLAAEADVCKGVMALAVRELVSQGILRARPGAGIRVLPAGGMSNTTGGVSVRAIQRGWRRIENEIVRDILRGTFDAEGELPPVAVLARRYGGCYRTVRRALAEICTQGILVEEQRRYRVRYPWASQGTATVLFLTGATLLRYLENFERTAEVYRMLEGECARSGMRLVPVGYAPEEGRFSDVAGHTVDLAQVQRSESVLGCIVWCSALPTKTALGHVIRRALECGRPVAVVDEDAVTEEVVGSVDTRQLRIFLLGCTVEPGLSVGRYLYGLGHRRVLYIAPFHSDRATWSHRRLAGLRRIFSDANPQEQWVKAVTATQYFFAGDYARDHPGVVEQITSAFRALGRSGQLTDTLARAVVDRLAQEVPFALDNEYARSVCGVLFDRGCEYHDATAWVCDSDQTALFALDYLRARRVRVPGQLSVIGFDDLRAASRWRLTTYAFDLAGMTRALLAHVASPVSEVRRQELVTEVPGYVVARQTVGRPTER